MPKQRIIYYAQQAFEKETFGRAIRITLFVGVLLNVINNPSLLQKFSLNELSFTRVLLTFLVPYCVSTYASVLSKSKSTT